MATVVLNKCIMMATGRAQRRYETRHRDKLWAVPGVRPQATAPKRM